MNASIRSIASALDVSICTVSKALRKDPKISVSTRERVQAEAARQGYRPNPALSRTAGRRSRKPKPAAGEPLAFIYGIAPGITSPENVSAGVIAGARERAGELGYALDIYLADAYGRPSALDRVIYNRGVQGVILGAFIGTHPSGLPLRWERYAGVWTSQRWLPLNFPLVRTSYLSSIRESIAAIAARGYRRLGTLLWEDPQHEFQHFAQLAAIRAFELKSPEGLRVLKPHILKKGQWSETLVRSYILKDRPDVLLVQDYLVYTKLLEMGIRFPEDMGMVLIYLPGGGVDAEGRRLSGVGSASKPIGREAVNMIDTALRHGNYGLGHDREIVLPNSFVDGETLGPQKK